MRAEAGVSDGASDDLALAQDLGARICHDLGGPVGTVAGMLDLLPDDDGEMLASAREGAAELRRRLVLWRAATGGAGPVPLSDLPDIARGLLAGGRATLSMAIEAAPADAGQLLLLAAMIAGEALPKGGAIELAEEAGDLVVLADGPLVRWPTALLALLAGDAAEPGPRSVVPRLFLRVVAAQGWTAELLADRAGIAPMLLLHRPAD